MRHSVTCVAEGRATHPLLGRARTIRQDPGSQISGQKNETKSASPAARTFSFTLFVRMRHALPVPRALAEAVELLVQDDENEEAEPVMKIVADCNSSAKHSLINDTAV